MTEEERKEEYDKEAEAILEAESSGEAPPAAPEPAPETLINVKVQIPVASNDALKQLSEYWEETEQQAARDLLVGSIQRHYTICKAHRRF